MENKNVLRQKISNEKFYEQVGIVLRKKISNVEDGIYIFGEPIHQNFILNLSKKFEIKNINEFTSYFLEVLKGDGNEFFKISKVHSSSLLPLLFFYKNVIENKNGLTINGIKYVNLCFEFKIYSLNKRNHYDYPSNIDVVLADKDFKTFLFIESKFSEPLREPFDSQEMSRAYLEDDFTKQLLLNIKDTWQTKDDSYLKDKCIKQMTDHFSAISSFLKNGKESACKYLHYEENQKNFRNNCEKSRKENNVKIYLTTIVYDFNKDKLLTDSSCLNNFNNYLDSYNCFCNATKKLLDNEICVLNYLTYQQLYENLAQYENFDKENDVLNNYYNFSKHD